MTVWRYITLRFLSRVLIVSALILGLVLLLTMIDNMSRAAAVGRGTDFAAKLTLTQAPATLSKVFPLVLMLASLWTFLGLSRSSELVILRAAGVSALRFLLFPLIAAILLGGIAVTVFNPVVAVTTQAHSALRDEMSRGSGNVLSLSEDALWLRQGGDDGQTVIEARRVSADGLILFGVRMHRFNTENTLTSRIEARSAALSDGVWVLRGVTRWDLSPGDDGRLRQPEQLPELRLPTDLSQERILDTFASPEAVSIWEMPEFIQSLENAGFSAQRHRVFFHTELARPALFAAMVLIGAAFALRNVRFGQTGVMVLMAVFSGFLLYFFKDLTESLGNAGSVPSVLAAWTPPMVAILLSITILLHLEDG
ncbi:LPS export ABC transporter permease LptG [Halovulum sp. GXIMD14793]